MTHHQARRLLLLAALVLVVTMVALTGVRSDRPVPDRGTTRPKVAVSRGGHDAQHGPQPHDRLRDPHGHHDPADADERRAARGAAASFVGALLRYQAGRPPGTWRRGITAAARPRLARRLIARPPRPPRTGVAPLGRVRSLEVHGPERGHIRASALIAYGARSPSLLDLELRERGGRWLVTELYR